MPKAIQPAPDWFDRAWEEYAPQLPIYLRNDATKKLARGFLGVLVQGMGDFAKSREGMRQLIAYAKISAILKGARGVADAPDPSPEEVADFVERLVARVKP